MKQNGGSYIPESAKPKQTTQQPPQSTPNGGIDYKLIQIDVIITPNEHYDTTLFYMGGNDLGNFMGRIAQGFSSEIDTI